MDTVHQLSFLAIHGYIIDARSVLRKFTNINFRNLGSNIYYAIRRI